MAKLSLGVLILNIGACLEFSAWDLEFHCTQFPDNAKI